MKARGHQPCDATTTNVRLDPGAGEGQVPGHQEGDAPRARRLQRRLGPGPARFRRYERRRKTRTIGACHEGTHFTAGQAARPFRKATIVTWRALCPSQPRCSGDKRERSIVLASLGHSREPLSLSRTLNAPLERSNDDQIRSRPHHSIATPWK
jgi:hypothetical protein